MSFTVKLQTSTAEVNRVVKESTNPANNYITDILSAEGTLRGESSIINPEILVEADVSALTGCNYATIPSLGRCYFVGDIVSVRQGLARISCHVDVLSSFATQIKNNYAIINRQERLGVYNLYLNDGSLRTYQNPIVQTKEFPNGFTTEDLVLIIAGPHG